MARVKLRHFVLFGLFLCPVLSLAEGPKIPRHQDPSIQLEFENVYQDIRVAKRLPVVSSITIPAGSTNYIQNTNSPTTATQVFSVTTATETVNHTSIKQTAPRSDTITQYGAAESNSGMRINANDTVDLLSRGTEALRVNAGEQILATGDGTACLPSFTFSTDAGTGLFLPVSDQLGFGVGCSTAAKMGQIALADYQNNNPFSIYGGSSTSAGTNTRVDYYIYTSSVSTTNNKIGELNQLAVRCLVYGRTSDFATGFFDQIAGGFFTSPTTWHSLTLFGAPGTRTYSRNASTGALLLRMSAGDFLVQSYCEELTGK